LRFKAEVSKIAAQIVHTARGALAALLQLRISKIALTGHYQCQPAWRQGFLPIGLHV
jgi:hypothetical protein